MFALEFQGGFAPCPCQVFVVKHFHIQPIGKTACNAVIIITASAIGVDNCVNDDRIKHRIISRNLDNGRGFGLRGRLIIEVEHIIERSPRARQADLPARRGNRVVILVDANRQNDLDECPALLQPPENLGNDLFSAQGHQNFVW